MVKKSLPGHSLPVMLDIIRCQDTHKINLSDRINDPRPSTFVHSIDSLLLYYPGHSRRILAEGLSGLLENRSVANMIGKLQQQKCGPWYHPASRSHAFSCQWHCVATNLLLWQIVGNRTTHFGAFDLHDHRHKYAVSCRKRKGAILQVWELLLNCGLTGCVFGASVCPIIF